MNDLQATDYKYGFSKPENYVFKSKKGLDVGVVEEISSMKGEPVWMRDLRIKALGIFAKKKMPSWGADLSSINFDDIYYYIKPTDNQKTDWRDLPKEIKDTYDAIGIPEAERNLLAGVTAQYECITGDALVFGNPGMTALKDLERGSYVYSLNEATRKLEKQKVSGLSYKGKRSVYKIKVAGRTIRCTSNHPFLVLKYDKSAGKKRGKFSTEWEYLQKLKVGDYIAVTKDIPDGGKPYELPKVSFVKEYIGKNQAGTFLVEANYLYTRSQPALNVPKLSTESLLWLAGLYLGDGYITGSVLSIAIPSTEKAMRNKVKEAFWDVFNYKLADQKELSRIRVQSKPIIELFTKLGLRGTAKTKLVPSWVIKLPKSQKSALIAGCIDSDGYLRSSHKNCDVWITSINYKMLEQLHMLALSCGLHATGIHKFKYIIHGKETNRTAVGYRLQITGDLSPLCEYSLKVQLGFTPRKYYHTYGTHHSSPLKKYISDQIGFAPIKEIVPDGEDAVYDIEVEGHHNFIANGILVHNSEAVYHSFQKKWEDMGVIFCDMDTALRKYPDIVKSYFGRSIPAADNKFAALNSAVWSGGSFIYVPPGVKVDIPLQAYFRINAANMGQFERTLIIVDEGAYVHYVEGCTAPVYSTDSLHAAVVEIFVKKGARCRYTTIQNWSNNVYNLVTKRAFVEEDGVMEWVDGNLGCLTENAKVYTNPGGLVSIKDLKAGDWIYTTDLNSLRAIKSKVNALVDQGIKPVFKVITSNYRELEATANHPFMVLRKTPNIGLQTLCWDKLGNLEAGDWIAVSGELPDDGRPYLISFDYNSKFLKYRPKIPRETNEELMWLLGLYLGDGCMDRSSSGVARRIYFAVPPGDRARGKLEDFLKKVFRVKFAPKGISLTVNSTVLAKLFLDLGFSGTAKTKRIPNWIFGLPRRQKLALIEGYFDADGYLRKAIKKDGQQYGQIVFASANKSLLEELKLLMVSVGIDPLKISVYVKERKLYKGRLKEYISYYLAMNIKGNLERIKGKTEFDPSVRFVRIRSIEPVGRQRVYDIEVDKTENFIANGVVVHNSKITMKYPSCYLVGRGARGEILSLALAGSGQHQDAGGKLMFLAPDTSGEIISKSVSVGTGRTSYRGLVKIIKNAERVKCNVRCDALVIDEASRSDTYPTMEVAEDNVQIGHEASVSRIGEEQLFYLMSRGLSEVEATSLIVNGFIEPIVKELPLEYAVELNRLINMSMEGAVG